MPLSESLLQQALRELGEEKCAVCGEPKAKQKPFCTRCYLTLPHAKRVRLSTLAGPAYATHYDECKDFIRCEL